MLAALAIALSLVGSDPPPLEKRWVYLATNLLVDSNIERDIAIMERAKKAGYNGVVLTDSKFYRWDSLGQHYKDNATRFRSAVNKLGMECVVCVASMGYSNDLLSKDPNLAEGFPVENAPFLATPDGKLVPANDGLKIVDVGFEDGVKGWAWLDPICTIDTAEKAEGTASLKMANAKGENARACQPLKIEPHRYYHLSAKVKTQDFDAVGSVNILLLAKNGQALQHRSLPIERTMGWKTIDVTFNTLNNTEVNFYVGVWGMRGGTIWWDDLRVEPGGLVNLVRRAGAPFKVTSGNTIYEEGRDFQGAVDPKMGNIAWPGDYDVWHASPIMAIPPGSRIKPGDTVRVSYSHTALVYEGQAMACMAEPGTDKILTDNIRDVHKYLQPDGYFLSHDEIRMTGWDASCLATGKKPGQMLADNVRKCIAMVRKEDPGKAIYVWSDMFDPTHNAQPTGPYYLVKGDGPWNGSWAGLDNDVVIVNWNSNPEIRKKSLAFFAGRGHKQILAGYYDGPVEAIQGWLKDAGKVAGVMYTTWQSNYRDLESFAKTVPFPGSR